MCSRPPPAPLTGLGVPRIQSPAPTGCTAQASLTLRTITQPCLKLHAPRRPSPRKGYASSVVKAPATPRSPPQPPLLVPRQTPLAPPALALDLPGDADLGATALAFTDALGEAYVAFRNYVPLILLPSPGPRGWRGVPTATDATRLDAVLPETARSADAGGLHLLWMGGKGLDRNPAWWRQGTARWLREC